MSKARDAVLDPKGAKKKLKRKKGQEAAHLFQLLGCFAGRTEDGTRTFLLRAFAARKKLTKLKGRDASGKDVVARVTGFLAANDLASFTAKLVRLVVDKELRTAMGEAADQAAEAYTIERTGTLILDHYELLVKEAGDRKRGLRGLLNRWLPARGKRE